MRKLFFLFVFLALLVKGDFVCSQESNPGPNLASSDLGSISFYLDKKSPATQGQSVHMVEESNGYFCLQLNDQVPDIAQALKSLRQVEMILEGDGESPQKLKIKSKLKKGLIYPKFQTCYTGKFTIPMGTPAGKYRVVDLNLLLASGHSIFLRDHLDQFKPKGLVEVASPIKDITPPVIEKIESWVPLENEMNMRHSRAWTYVYFRVTATDQDIGIDPNSFQIFFKIYLDDVLVDIMQAKCSTILPNLNYDCRLYFSRAEHDFYGRTLRMVLDSVSVADKHGNLAELTTPAQLEKIFGGKLLRYIFYSHKPPKANKPESQVSSEPDEEDHSELSEKPKPVLINRRRDRY